MLPKKYRLTKNAEFLRVNRSGKRAFSAYFRLNYLANHGAASRFGQVISNKISKKATVRNRLKRQVSEIIRLNKRKIIDGYDLVIFLNQQAIGRTYQELEKELVYLLNKAKLLKNE